MKVHAQNFIDLVQIFLLSQLILVYRARPSFAAAIMPFQHTWGKEDLAGVIYIHKQLTNQILLKKKSMTSDNLPIMATSKYMRRTNTIRKATRRGQSREICMMALLSYWEDAMHSLCLAAMRILHWHTLHSRPHFSCNLQHRGSPTTLRSWLNRSVRLLLHSEPSQTWYLQLSKAYTTAVFNTCERDTYHVSTASRLGRRVIAVFAKYV